MWCADIPEEKGRSSGYAESATHYRSTAMSKSNATPHERPQLSFVGTIRSAPPDRNFGFIEASSVRRSDGKALGFEIPGRLFVGGHSFAGERVTIKKGMKISFMLAPGRDANQLRAEYCVEVKDEAATADGATLVQQAAEARAARAEPDVITHADWAKLTGDTGSSEPERITEEQLLAGLAATPGEPEGDASKNE